MTWEILLSLAVIAEAIAIICLKRESDELFDMVGALLAQKIQIKGIVINQDEDDNEVDE